MTTTERGPLWSERLNPRNWSLALKLLIVGLVPTLLALGLGALRISDQADVAADLGRSSDVLALRDQVGGTAGALRDERDTAVRFVAGNRTGDRAAVESAAAKTDAQLARADQTLAGSSSLDPAAAAAAAQLRSGIGSLQTLRTDTLTSTLPADAIVNRYTDVVGLADVLDRAMLRQVSSPSVAGLADALTAVNTAEEQLALQHTVIAAAIAAGQLREVDRATLTSTESAYNTAFHSYVLALTPEQQRAFGNFGTDPANGARVQLVAGLQQTAAGRAPPATAAAWDAAYASSMDVVTRAGTSTDGALKDQTTAAQGAASNDAGINSVILMLGLLLGIVIIVLLARSLLKSLRLLRTSALDIAERQLPNAVEALRSGESPNVNVEPVPVDSRDEVGQVARAFDAVHGQAVRLAADQAALQANVNSMFVNLSRRSQALVERQLQLIEQLESNEQDADQLSNLFQLDHLATRMRRNSENLLVLAGTELSKRNIAPVPVVDVLRAAVSEVEQYQRIVVQTPPAVSLVGRAASDLVHLLAELLDNATNFSPPDSQVVLSSTRTDDGSVLVEIADRGVGMVEFELADANQRLSGPAQVDVSASRRMGLFVVGRLGARHGVGVRLGTSTGGPGGLTASVTVPGYLVHDGSAQRLDEPPTGLDLAVAALPQTVTPNGHSGTGLFAELVAGDDGTMLPADPFRPAATTTSVNGFGGIPHERPADPHSGTNRMGVSPGGAIAGAAPDEPELSPAEIAELARAATPEAPAANADGGTVIAGSTPADAGAPRLLPRRVPGARLDPADRIEGSDDPAGDEPAGPADDSTAPGTPLRVVGTSPESDDTRADEPPAAEVPAETPAPAPDLPLLPRRVRGAALAGNEPLAGSRAGENPPAGHAAEGRPERIARAAAAAIAGRQLAASSQRANGRPSTSSDDATAPADGAAPGAEARDAVQADAPGTDTATTDAAQSVAAQSVAAQSDEVRPAAAQAEAVESDAARSEAVPTEPAQPSQTDAGQTDADRPGAVRIDAAQSEAAQSEVAQSEVAQSEATQSEATQSEVTQSEVTQSEPTRPGADQSTARSAAAQSGTDEAGTDEASGRQPGTAQPAGTRPGDVPNGVPRPDSTPQADRRSAAAAGAAPQPTTPDPARPGAAGPQVPGEAGQEARPITGPSSPAQPGGLPQRVSAAQAGASQPGAARPNGAQPGSARPNAAQPDGTQRGPARPGGVFQPGSAQPAAAQPVLPQRQRPAAQAEGQRPAGQTPAAQPPTGQPPAGQAPAPGQAAPGQAPAGPNGAAPGRPGPLPSRTPAPDQRPAAGTPAGPVRPGPGVPSGPVPARPAAPQPPAPQTAAPQPAAQQPAAPQPAAAQRPPVPRPGAGPAAPDGMDEPSGFGTPIFAEIASAWFRSNRPIPVNWADEVPQGPPTSLPPIGDPLLGRAAPPPPPHGQPVPPAQPGPAPRPPAPLPGDGRSAGAALPQRGGPQQRDEFASVADEGWHAAEEKSTGDGDELTAAGLPKRRPRARLVPGSAAGSAVLAPSAPPEPAGGRTADAVRGRLASYQQGVRQGRENRLRRERELAEARSAGNTDVRPTGTGEQDEETR